MGTDPSREKLASEKLPSQTGRTKTKEQDTARGVGARAMTDIAAVQRISAHWRRLAAERDPIGDRLERLAKCTPAELPTLIVELSERKIYPTAISRLQKLLLQETENRIAENILVRGLHEETRVLRMGLTFSLFDASAKTQRMRPRISAIDLVDFTLGPRAREAWLTLHSLGHVRSAAGVIPIDTTSAATPGFWPADLHQRYALAVNLIVRRMAGDRFDFVLVQP